MKKFILILLFMFMIVPNGYSEMCSKEEHFWGTFKIINYTDPEAHPEARLDLRFEDLTQGYDTIGLESIKLDYIVVDNRGYRFLGSIKMPDLGPRIIKIETFGSYLSEPEKTLRSLFYLDILDGTLNFNTQQISFYSKNTDRHLYYIKISSMRAVECSSVLNEELNRAPEDNELTKKDKLTEDAKQLKEDLKELRQRVNSWFIELIKEIKDKK